MTEPSRQDMIEALKFCLIDLAHVINLDSHRPALRAMLEQLEPPSPATRAQALHERARELVSGIEVDLDAPIEGKVDLDAPIEGKVDTP